MQKKDLETKYSSLRVTQKLAKKIKILVALGDFRSAEELIWNLIEKCKK